MQLAVDAFVGVQTSPHALQLLVVLSVVHVPPQVVSWQVHAPSEQSGVGCAQAAPSCQLPLALQLCGVLARQVAWPGEQTPMQAPLTQVWLVQATAPPHVPPEVHDATPLPEQVVCPGAHIPVHAPLMHVWLTHVAGSPQLPPDPQVSTPLLTQVVALGEHATHVLLRQTGVVPEHVFVVCHPPELSQD